MIHYPPVSEKLAESGFTQVFEEYNVSKVIYGHLHGTSTSRALNGEFNNVKYLLTSSDFLKFDPVKIL
jgi:hypothetical protein